MKKIKYRIVIHYHSQDEVCAEIDNYIAALGIFNYFSDPRYWQSKKIDSLVLQGRTVSTGWTNLKTYNNEERAEGVESLYAKKGKQH